MRTKGHGGGGIVVWSHAWGLAIFLDHSFRYQPWAFVLCFLLPGAAAHIRVYGRVAVFLSGFGSQAHEHEDAAEETRKEQEAHKPLPAALTWIDPQPSAAAVIFDVESYSGPNRLWPPARHSPPPCMMFEVWCA